MKVEEIFNEEVILEEEIIQEVTETQPGIKRQIVFNREVFADTQLGNKKVRDIIEDDTNFPKVSDKVKEILDRMDRNSRNFWRKHIKLIMKKEED